MDTQTNTNTTTTPKKEPSKTLIYVSNLPFDTTDEQFKDLFKGFSVKTAYVAKRKNGNSKGFGFVNLEKESDQNAAIESVNGKEFNSRKLNAKVAMNDDRRNENGELREEFKTQSQNKSAPSETVVYVSNLEWTVNDESLKKIFADFNPKVATVATRRNGKSKGFGFVEFNNKEDQEKALKLDNFKLEGREIAVKASTGYRGDKPREQRKSNVRSVKRDNNNNRDNRRQNSFTLFVTNLPLELDDNDLKDIFQEFHPRNARIINARNGSSKGYGFVEFNNSRDQNDALRALDQSEINDRVVTVKKSTSSGRDNNRRDNNRRDNNNRNNDNRRNNNNNDNRRNNNNNNNRRNNNNNNNNNNNTRPPRNENREISSTLVYVSNLPFNIDDKGLEEIFKGLKSNKAYITRRRNGYSKGFGFVDFASAEDQKKAIESNGTEIGGRKIVVQAAFKVDEKSQQTTIQN